MRRTWRVTPWRRAFIRERCLPCDDLGPVERFAFSRLISARERFAVDVDRAICAVSLAISLRGGVRSQKSGVRRKMEGFALLLLILARLRFAIDVDRDTCAAPFAIVLITDQGRRTEQRV